MKRIVCCLVPFFVWGVFIQKSFAEESREIKVIPISISNSFPELIKKLKKELEKVAGKDLTDKMFRDHRLKVYSSPFVRTGTAKKRKDNLKRVKEEYEKNVMSSESLNAGAIFLHTHWDFLTALEKKTSVDPYTSVTMLRIETNFGKVLGDRPVLNNLYSLYLISPRTKRKQFALNQISCFLKIAKANNWDIFSIKGSWAGAFGLPQFIPCTYKAYAIDGDGDGIIDIFKMKDAFANAANLLEKCGWVRNKRKALLCYNGWGFYADLALKYRKSVRVVYAKQKLMLVLKKQ